MKERYYISGMTCSACSAHVEKSVNKTKGVKRASVNLLTETMEVEYDEGLLDGQGIIRAVEKAGYGASPLGKKEERRAGIRGTGMDCREGVCNAGKNGAEAGPDIREAGGIRGGLKRKALEESRAMRVRLGVSVAFLLPLMYVAMFHMYKEWFGLPVPEFVMRAFHGSKNAVTFSLTQLLLLLPILYVNRKFFIVGFKTLAHLSPNMDSLIALGAAAATGYGIFAMYRISYGLGHGNMALVEQYSHDLYFESAGMILTLITVGKYLEGRSKGKTGEAITKLMDLSPKMAVILTQDGTEKEIPTQDMCSGDIFLVKPGSLVPADGVVIEGRSSIDEAALTGESVPVEKKEGDRVVSATLNKAGFLKCRADRVGEDTTLAQIIRLVEEASASKAPIAQLADKVAGIFVPAVMGIALITLIGWLAAGAGAEFAISTAIAVLVISCPCALGLATPVAIMVGTGVGAGHGILIKSGEALQQAREIDTVVLDKTGTVTEGKLQVVQTETVSDVFAPGQLLSLAAALEQRSEHPLAEAVVKAAEPASIQVTDFQAVFGRGILGRLQADWLQEGRYYVGNRAFLQENGIETAESSRGIRLAEKMADAGCTPLFVAGEGQLLGVIGVADQVKETSLEAIKAWKEMGVQVMLLTGDNKRTAEAVRKTLGIEKVAAEVLPEDKERIVSGLKAQGRRVAMIGDGINDAPALAAADVGMAIGAGADVAIESADIILMKSDLRDAVTAMSLSRAVIRNIKENLFWAFFYNSIGIPLAAGLLYPVFGLRLNPMFGAAAMSLSSIFVVGNALRLRGFKGNFGQKPDREEEGRKAQEKQSPNLEMQNRKNQSYKTENQKGEKQMKKVLIIEGMMCEHCTGRVKKALEAVEGVTEVTMSLEEKSAAVELAKEASEEALTAAVTEAGYEVKQIL